jgi:Ca2+-binding EF-hand superfamily protein
MISGVGGMGNYSSMMPMQGMRQKDPEKMFSKIDASGDGGIDQAELNSFAEKISEKTGQTIDSESGLANFDANGDGKLDMGELKSLMDDSGLQPPNPNYFMVMSAYSKNQEDDSISSLLETLNDSTEESTSLLESLQGENSEVTNLLDSIA